MQRSKNILRYSVSYLLYLYKKISLNMKRFVIISVLIFICMPLLAQNPQQRMSVHPDRDAYAPGEAVWFCVYLRDFKFDSEELADSGIKATLLDSAGRRVSFTTAKVGDLAANVKMYPGVIFLDDDIKPGRYLLDGGCGKTSGRSGDVHFSREITVVPQGSGIGQMSFHSTENVSCEREPRESADSLIDVTSLSNAAFVKIAANACPVDGRYALYLTNDLFKNKIADIQGGMQNDAVLRIARNRLAPGVNTVSLEDEKGDIAASKEFSVVPTAAETISCIPSFTAKPSGKRSACSLTVELRDGDGKAVDGKFSISVLDSEAMKSLHPDSQTAKALSSVSKQWRRQQGNDRSYLQNKDKKPVDTNIPAIDHICNLYSAFIYENGSMYNQNAGFVNRSGAGFQPVALIVNGVQEYSWAVLENMSMEHVEIVDMSSSPSALYKNSGGGYVSVTINSAASTRTGFAEADRFPGRIGPGCSFYSPRYDLDRISAKKDMRNTIFWNPFVGTVDGKADIPFCTSDSGARSYYVVIYGVTLQGYVFSWQGIL